jgi:hypothetical protein
VCTCACSSPAITARGRSPPWPMRRTAMRPTVTVRAATLIQHLGLTRRVKAEVQNLSKRPSRPANPDPGRDAA